MAISTVIIRKGSADLEGGDVVFTFDPVPTGVTFDIDNAAGKMSLDLPSFARPLVMNSRSSERRLVIKTVLLGTDFGEETILNQLDDLLYIMSGNESDWYQIRVPFNENFVGSPHIYTTSDSAMDNKTFIDGENYMQYFCFPDRFTIDKITRNICYITLVFSEASDVFVMG